MTPMTGRVEVADRRVSASQLDDRSPTARRVEPDRQTSTRSGWPCNATNLGVSPSVFWFGPRRLKAPGSTTAVRRQWAAWVDCGFAPSIGIDGYCVGGLRFRDPKLPYTIGRETSNNSDRFADGTQNTATNGIRIGLAITRIPVINDENLRAKPFHGYTDICCGLLTGC
jgi:hypothetical protein